MRNTTATSGHVETEDRTVHIPEHDANRRSREALAAFPDEPSPDQQLQHDALIAFGHDVLNRLADEFEQHIGSHYLTGHRVARILRAHNQSSD